jgi:hypothetical protein
MQNDLNPSSKNTASRAGPNRQRNIPTDLAMRVVRPGRVG